MQKILLTILLLGLCSSAWGQLNPKRKFNSRFQPPRFYVNPQSADSLKSGQKQKQTAIPDKDQSVLAEPQQQEEINLPNLLQQPVKVAQDSVEMSKEQTEVTAIPQSGKDLKEAEIQPIDHTRQQLDSLMAVMRADRQRQQQLLDSLSKQQLRISEPNIIQIDSAQVLETQTESPTTLAQQPIPSQEYTAAFQSLETRMIGLQAQMELLANKQEEAQIKGNKAVAAPTQVAAQQPANSDNEAALAALQKEIEKLQELYEAENALSEAQKKRLEGLDKQIQRMTRSQIESNKVADQSYNQIKRKLDLILAGQVTNTVATVAQPKTEVVVQQDTALQRQMQALNAQLAGMQDSSGAPDSLVLQQLTQLQEEMNSFDQERQRFQIQLNQVKAERDSLALLAQQPSEPQLIRDTVQVTLRDTITNIQTSVDTLRVQDQLLGLERSNIYFKKGSSDIFEADIPMLEKLAEMMQAEPKLNMILTGYADAMSGSAALNLRLSRERAEALKLFFTQKGIEAERIAVEAFGSSQPAYRNSLDRRVELKLILE